MLVEFTNLAGQRIPLQQYIELCRLQAKEVPCHPMYENFDNRTDEEITRDYYKVHGKEKDAEDPKQ
jgi:hypothetical protein